MRRTAFLLLTLALLTVPVCAVQLPGELLDALPEEAAALAEGEGITEDGVQLLVQSFFDALRASLDRSLRGAVYFLKNPCSLARTHKKARGPTAARVLNDLLCPRLQCHRASFSIAGW